MSVSTRAFRRPSPLAHGPPPGRSRLPAVSCRTPSCAPANTQYINGLGFTAAAPANQANYTTKVNAVNTDHPRHFTIRVVTATPPGWKNATTLHLTPALLQAADAWKWFADMVAIDCSALANPAAGFTGALVQSRIVRSSVPPAVVSPSA